MWLQSVLFTTCSYSTFTLPPDPALRTIFPPAFPPLESRRVLIWAPASASLYHGFSSFWQKIMVPAVLQSSGSRYSLPNFSKEFCSFPMLGFCIMQVAALGVFLSDHSLHSASTYFSDRAIRGTLVFKPAFQQEGTEFCLWVTHGKSSQILQKPNVLWFIGDPGHSFIL